MQLRARKGIITHDISMVPIAWLGTFWLQFDLSRSTAGFLDHELRLLPLVVVVQGAVFLCFGLYRCLWKFVSIPDLVRIAQAVAVGVPLCALCTFSFTGMNHVSYASFILFALLLVVLLSGPRLAWRWFNDRRSGKASTKRALIVGAGEGGAMLVGMTAARSLSQISPDRPCRRQSRQGGTQRSRRPDPWPLRRDSRDRRAYQRRCHRHRDTVRERGPDAKDRGDMRALGRAGANHPSHEGHGFRSRLDR